MSRRSPLVAPRPEGVAPSEEAPLGRSRGSGCSIRTVTSRRDLETFVDLPYRLHRDRSCWVPPFRRDQRRLLDRTFNPFFEYGEAAYFLAVRGGRALGRIAAIENRRHNEWHGDRMGFFGFFESTNDPDVACSLVAAAADWASARDLERLRGPLSFSIHQECGLLVDGFERPPAAMMPYHPPYYEGLLRAAGLEPVRDLLVYAVGSRGRALRPPERLERLASWLERRGDVEVRPCDPRRLEREARCLCRILATAWEGSWGFVPPTEAEVGRALRALKPMLLPDLLVFAVVSGREVGCALAVPDVGHHLLRNRSGRSASTALAVLWSIGRRRFDALRVVLLGVEPEQRHKGVDAMLYRWMWRCAASHAVERIEAGWIADVNRPMRSALEKMGFGVAHRYRVFESAVAAGAAEQAGASRKGGPIDRRCRPARVRRGSDNRSGTGRE